MNRGTTNTIRKIIDEFIPPIIRDSRWFMYIFFWYWFKKKNLDLYMDFKKRAWGMTESEFTDCYRNLDCRATDRPTDLNKKSISFMLEKLNTESTTLLDVGCGRGYWLSILKQKTNLDLTGCDLFEKGDLEGIKYAKGDIENLPFADNSFDIVTCCHTIEHIRDIKKAITELKRVAKRQIVIVTPKQRYYYYTLDLHLHFFPVSEYLTQLVGLNNFECINCKGDWCYVADI
ncbi:MAG TPA: class I SAM-dependent methyltransferase [Chitinophagaceae bacterium]|nr:class I SAM-dependent methyltransferase [Chitinophagaceae bacterium]